MIRALLQRLRGDSLWLVGQSVYTMVLGLVMTGLAARAYGPVAFGLLAVAIAINLVLTPLATLGTESVVLHTLVKGGYADAVVVRTTIVLRLVATAGLLTILASSLLVADARSYAPEVILPLGLALVLKTGESHMPWFQAHGQIPRSAVARMVAYTGTVVVRAVVLATGLPLEIYALTYALDAALVWLALVLARRGSSQVHESGRFSRGVARMLLARSWPLILSGLAVSAYNRMDQVMLGIMLPDRADVGRYAAAVTIAEAWYFVPMAVIVARQAGVMKAHGSSIEQFRHESQRLFDATGRLCVLGAVSVALGSPLLVSVIFGDAFVSKDAIICVAVLSAAGVLAVLGSARGPWLIAQGLERYSLLYLSVGAGLNFLLNLLLIPYMGIAGAAIATLVAQAMSVLVVPALVSATRPSVMHMASAMNLWRLVRMLSKRTSMPRGVT